MRTTTTEITGQDLTIFYTIGFLPDDPFSNCEQEWPEIEHAQDELGNMVELTESQKIDIEQDIMSRREPLFDL